jgi:hypothetical protein
MNTPEQRPRLLIMVGAMFVVAASVALVWISARSEVLADTLRAEAAEMRAQLEEQERTIAELKSLIQQRHRLRPAADAPQIAEQAAIESPWARQAAELASLQSETAAILEKILDRLDPKPPPFDPDAHMRRIDAIEEKALEQQIRLQAAEEKVVQLVVGLAIPEQITGMDPNQGLGNPHLHAYWPFFKAKRELQTLLRISDSLQLRLAQEQVEIGH